MKRTIILMLAVGLAACASQEPRPTQAPETSLVGQPPKEAPPAPKKKAMPVETEVAPPDEEVRVELVMLEKGNPYMTDTGVKVSLAQKNPVRITMESSSETIELALPEGTKYAEGRAFESIWSIEVSEALHLELRHDPPEPLSSEQAAQMAKQELDANLGCEGEDRQVESAPGTIRFERVADGAAACSAQIGIYTGRVITR